MRLLIFSNICIAITWWSLWETPDQHGQRLMQQGEYLKAAEVFQDPLWRGTAWYRAGEFKKAEVAFALLSTPESDFNRGNSLVMQGKYNQAIESYDRALALKPIWDAPEKNKMIAQARAKEVEQKGGDLGDQKIGADEIIFDKKNEQGTDTEIQSEIISDQNVQELWLRNVQTKPADFLKAKFGFQVRESKAKRSK